jgi:hypothetical protein
VSQDLFDKYLLYRKDTEPPVVFHRWALTACIGAWMGRQAWIPFGSSKIFPTQYIMFVGDPGSRKTTAIKMATSLLRATGYDKFGAQRTSKEKFLMDLAGEAEEFIPGKEGKQILDAIEVLNVDNGEPKEVFIDADEFNNFMGPANIEFQSILGELWDWDNPDAGYKFRLKNSRSLDIFQPTVSILSGNTPSNFAQCFPPASIGQGFMSRLLLVHGESTGKKITFPEEPPDDLKQDLMRTLLLMKQRIHGKVEIDGDARHMLDMIYRTWPDLEDLRFKHYSTRRFTHLLRLCMIYCFSRLSGTIEAVDVIRANTVLAYIETLMPKALGEMGKSRHAEAANKIMQCLFAAREPVDTQHLWKIVRSDLEKPTDLTQVLSNLQFADQIHLAKSEVTGKTGYLPKIKPIDRKVMYIDYNYLKGKELPK